MSDEELMLRAAQGEASLLDTLVRRYATRLLTFLVRLTGDHHHSEELFQEVFLLVWRKRRQYKFPHSFQSWLYAIALNCCRAAFRSRRPRPVSLEAEPIAAQDSPSDHALACETALLVSRALVSLPPQQRAVVTLRIWEELPYARIAEIVSCSEMTARSHMHHALASLRRDLHRLGIPQDLS